MTIGSSDGAGALLGSPTTIATDSRGRYFLTWAYRGSEPPWLFDMRGRFVQMVGSGGDGPNEYRRPKVWVGRGDTVHVFDLSNGRHTVLSPSLKVARTAIVGRVTGDAAILPNGHVVINGPRYDPERAGLALHEFDAEGAYVRSFDEFVFQPNDIWRAVRQLAVGRRGLWAANMAHRYVMTLWDSSARPILRLERDAEWFRPYDRLEKPTPTRPHSPTLWGIWEDSEGLVWTIAQVSNPNWQAGLGPPRGGEGGLEVYPVNDHDAVFDGIVEVIDPVAGSLVASRRFPRQLAKVVAPNLVTQSLEDATGAVFVRVYRVILRR